MEDLEWWFVTLLIPLGVWTFQQIGEVWRRWKRQDFLYNNILAEIERTQKENAVLKVAIVQALGSEAFRDRVKEPNYFIFVEIGDSSPSVFKSDDQEFSQLGRRASSTIIEFFESQSLIVLTLRGLRSADFRLISPKRKIEAIEKLLELLQHSDEIANECRKRMSRETKRTKYRRLRTRWRARRLKAARLWERVAGSRPAA